MIYLNLKNVVERNASKSLLNRRILVHPPNWKERKTKNEKSGKKKHKHKSSEFVEPNLIDSEEESDKKEDLEKHGKKTKTKNEKTLDSSLDEPPSKKKKSKPVEDASESSAGDSQNDDPPPIVLTFK